MSDGWPMSVLTAGYVVVDILDAPDGLRHSAGGTAANVACNLAWLGASSAVLARLGDDPAGRYLVADLARAGVDTSGVRLDALVSTPLAVHRVTPSGDHVFVFRCPRCHRNLPRVRPPTAAQARVAISARPGIFFFDRSPAAVLMAAGQVAAGGGLVFFEPNVTGRVPQCERAAALSHIVKVSDERLHELDLLVATARPGQLQIVTEGRRGLRFRIGGRRWLRLPAHPVCVLDSGGAGDWVSAGLIAHLMTSQAIDYANVAAGLRIGQALAAICCRSLGARGMSAGNAAAAILGEVIALAGFDPGWTAGRWGPQDRAVPPRAACAACLSQAAPARRPRERGAADA